MNRLAPWLVSTGLMAASAARADKPPAWADDPGLDCHFRTDPAREAYVDDRGGIGIAYDFIKEVGGGAGNSSFCPHCRLALFTSNLGISVTELAKVSKAVAEVKSLADLAIALELTLADAQKLLAALEGGELVEGLEKLKEAFGAADLPALKDAISGYITKITTQKNRLTHLGELLAATASGAGGLEGVDFWALYTELGFTLDSGFRATFNHPNDPKRLNSGLRVYSLPEILASLVKAKLPEALVESAQALLSAVPSLPGGGFEMSGDDDDAMQPARFHAKNADLTILQRTYAVPGNDVVLFQWTVVNDTDRYVPFVSVAMINDFDIPPLSYDKETAWDAVTSTAMVYDEHPYLDPPVHYWFGFSPVVEATLGGATITNWMVDDQFSLAQFGTDQTEENRVRFFLNDPSLSGDQDGAQGKSEKQAAIAMSFLGPFAPGEQHTVAFCVAEGDGGSKVAAKAKMLANMAACKGIYAVVTATCGDGQLQFGELCDDHNTADGDGCSSKCSLEKCGDALETANEECDDGNDEPNDGCSPECRVERCGDEVTQTDEECDDADLDDTDGCLSNCTLARCGDRLVRACDPSAGEACATACVGKDACFILATTLDDIPKVLNGKPTTGAFDGLLGVPLTFTIGFDVLATEQGGLPRAFPTKTMFVATAPITVAVDGPEPLASSLAAAFTGIEWQLELTTSTAGAGVALTTAPLQSQVTTTYGAELAGPLAAGVVGADGYPVWGAFSVTQGSFALRRYASGNMTDYGAGGLSADLTLGAAGPEGVEACDDGNASDVDGCTTACEVARCGDGLVQVDVEQCDGGPGGDGGCTAQCLLADAAACGDNDPDPGEECDDGNTNAGDGCTDTCQLEVCGDGVLRAGVEECDDGGVLDGDGCSAGCALEECGDGIQQGSEACDDGPANADDAACTLSCTVARCGDGVVRAGEETCDDGNFEAGDGCGPGCAVETCGDGQPGKGEQCDDANLEAGDGCSPECISEYCGDGQPGPGEQCDDGNAAAGDGCGKDCQLEFPEACGDQKVGKGEQCDDGGTEDGDGCSALCQLEDLAGCGDSVVGPGEECDDGNSVAGDGCASGCALERCGDGIQQPGEQCDDGDLDDGDGCSASCLAEPSECGNGKQELGEQCDDGNAVAGDGCEEGCVATEGSVVVTATCGNGAQDAGEQCDDGGHFEGDGCDEVCQLEASVCGNAKVEPGEGCDDGNTVAGDGCAAACATEAVCGNTDVELGEGCDDGNTVAGDGCNAVCKLEFCGDGVVQADEQCDDADENSSVTPDACRDTCQLPFCGDGVVDQGECDGQSPCAADCGLVEPKAPGGSCGRCDIRSDSGGATREGTFAAVVLVALAGLVLAGLRRS